jgi:DNA-binding HxlR family transcriptional regulator
VTAEGVSADQCAPVAEDLARAFGFLGKRWTAMILGHLSHGPAGFRDLSRGLGGISDSVLSERLAGLAAGGLITREVCDGPPVAVSYQLTDRGRALMPALDLIARWARDNLPPPTRDHDAAITPAGQAVPGRPACSAATASAAAR